MFPQYTLYQHPHSGAGCVAMGPIDGDVGFQAREQLVGDHLEVVVAEDINGATVLGQRIVKSYFVQRQTFFLAAPTGLEDVARQIDQLLQDFDRADRIGMVSGNRVFQTLREAARFHDVGAAARPHFVV